MKDFKDLVTEIHRRSLWQVLGIYVFGAYVAYQVILSLTEGGILPAWFPGVAVGLFIIGLPIVLATAFVQEGLPARSRAAPAGETGSSEDAPPGASTHHPFFTWKYALGAGVAVFAVAGAVGGGIMLGAPQVQGPSVGEASVAVLPFVNMSADEENQYFSDGLTEELLNALAKVPGLQVAARTSSFALRGEGLDVRQAGQRLGVEYVVEGSVRKADEEVRITAQLIRTDNGFHLWSDTYDRELSDVFAVQDEIARSIAGTLRLRLVGDSTLVERQTASPRAHDLYLLGLSEWNRRTVQSIQRAVGHFEDATAEDPDYARAHSGLALAAIVLPIYDPEAPAAEYMERARAAAERALEIDPGSAEAHTALGDIHWRYDYDPEAAEEAFQRAIAANPSYATAHQWYGEFLMADGRPDEALAELDRALELDPLSLVINTLHAMALMLADGPERALERLDRALEIDPTFGTAHMYVVNAELAAGRSQQAATAVERWLGFDQQLQPDQVHQMAAAVRAGEPTPEARAILESWDERGLALAPDFAVIYAAIGDEEGALTMLERSVDERTANLGNAVAYPVFDSMRDHPRFRAVMDRMGLRR